MKICDVRMCKLIDQVRQTSDWCPKLRINYVFDLCICQKFITKSYDTVLSPALSQKQLKWCDDVLCVKPKNKHLCLLKKGNGSFCTKPGAQLNATVTLS